MQVRASDVVLPEGAIFVVANSLAISNKAESATKHYNLRVVECRWVLWVLVGRFGLDQGGKVLLLPFQSPVASVAECGSSGA